MDKKGGGTEKNGKPSIMYCSSCYENGKFKKPNITMKEMQKLVDDVLKKEMKRWKIFRRLAIRQIPRLERRKNIQRRQENL
jgi:hypothetical protein